MIYEGTNGIQAMDLLGRKLPMNEGKTVMGLLEEMQHTIARAKVRESLNELTKRFENTVERLGDVGMHMFKLADSEKIYNAFAFAHPFMDVVGDVIIGWMHLWRAVVATEAINNGPKKKDREFYKGQLKSAEFFIRAVLPITKGRMETILDNCGAAIEISEDSFGGK
jgi:hypothetical protein